MPDVQWSLERVAVDRDLVAIEYTFAGTFENDFLGFVAQGQAVSGRGMEMHRLDRQACRFVQTWNYSDAYGFFAQLQ
jgi:predicted ester cyclase